MRTTEFLTIAGAIVPDRAAVYFDGESLSFADLQRRSNRLANAMAVLGIGKGDRVGVMQVNCPQAIEIYFAAAQLDAIYVPINFRSKEEELAQMLAQAQPAVMFIGQRYLPLLDAAAGVPPERVVILDAQPQEYGVGYEEFLAAAPDEELRFPEAEDSDTTVILFTAGTTGAPKGVMLTHDSFASYLLSAVTPADPDIEEINLLSVPFYHVAGLQAVLAAIYGGRSLVVVRQFDPEEWLAAVQRHRVNRAMIVPTMLKQLMDHPGFNDFDLSSLDVITYGGASMPLEVIKRAIEGVSRRSLHQRLRSNRDRLHHHHAASRRPCPGGQRPGD